MNKNVKFKQKHKNLNKNDKDQKSEQNLLIFGTLRSVVIVISIPKVSGNGG
jgi:hypothetical protein